MAPDPLLPLRDGGGIPEPLQGLEEDGEGKGILRGIERTNLVVVAMMVAGSLLLGDRSFTLGVAGGGGLMALNFRALRRILEGGFGEGRKGVFLKYCVKFLALLGCVGGILFFLRRWVDPLGFLIGTSGLFWALWIQGLRNLRRR